MAHDRNTIHVSHYQSSPTWRSAIAPEDRSWLLFIDVTGAPHLYLATETQDGEGQTVTTYAPCVRAMLRPEDVSGRPPEGVEAIHGVLGIRVHAHLSGNEAYMAGTEEPGWSAAGATPRAAVVALFDLLAEVDAAKGAAVLAL